MCSLFEETTFTPVIAWMFIYLHVSYDIALQNFYAFSYTNNYIKCLNNGFTSANTRTCIKRLYLDNADIEGVAF